MVREATGPTPEGLESVPSSFGLIAGEGKFPFLILEEAARRGLDVVTLLIEGSADPALVARAGGTCHWIGLGQVSRAVRIFREAKIDRAILAGRVQHVRAFDILRPDKLTLRVLARMPSRSTEAMLTTLADVLHEEQIDLLDSTLLLGDHMAREGSMTRRRPDAAEMEDLRFGWEMARDLARLDIGQTVVVKKKAVVAVEAMEGTDATIRRAGDTVKGPLVVVKVARPKQDMRFDVPVVGLGTIDSMVATGAGVLALEAGRVLLLEREELLERADRAGIAVFGIARE